MFTPLSRFLADLWLLLALRWSLTWNGFRALKWWGRILRVLGGLWLVGVVGVSSLFIGYGLGRLVARSAQRGLEGLVPGLILTAVGMLVLLSSFGIALGALFLASDLEMLMVAPVSRRAVFTAKILDGLAAYYGIVAITAIPGLVAYGLALAYGPGYYLLAIVAALGTPLLPAALGALLTLVVARFAPARRVREVLGLVGALVGIGCSLIGQTSRFWAQRVGNSGSTPGALLEQLRQLAALPLPSFVAGRGLAAAGEGRWLLAATDMVGFLLLTFGLFAAGIVVAERLYAAGWVRMQSSGTARRGRARAEGAGWLGRAPAWAAIALKDWRVIPRDLRNFAQVLSPLLLLPVIYINLLAGSGRRTSAVQRALQDVNEGMLDPLGIVIAAGVLLATVLVFRRIAGNAISMEGQSWWLLKIAPLSGAELLGGKFAAALIPYAAISTVLMAIAAIWQGFRPLGALYGWFGVELLGAGILAVSVGAAVPWARLDWDDPRRMGSHWGGLISLAAGLVLAALSGGFLCLPVIAAAFAPDLLALAWAVGPLVAVALTAGIGWGAFSVGVRMLGRVGEA